MDISNREFGVTWATANAPLVEIGEITTEQPWMKSIKTSSSIYSYVMNNYWHTNYKADQEGPVSFAYSIRPHAAFDATEAGKFGLEPLQNVVTYEVEDLTHLGVGEILARSAGERLERRSRQRLYAHDRL